MSQAEERKGAGTARKKFRGVPRGKGQESGETGRRKNICSGNDELFGCNMVKRLGQHRKKKIPDTLGGNGKK